MGRSCKSSHYQMSTSKYISRVHVRAAYLPAKSEHLDRVEVVCLGSNGIKIQCQGKSWELAPEDTFTSESQDSDIMVDVAGARVILQWPAVGRKIYTPEDSDASTDRENSPRRLNAAPVYRSPFSSPLRNRARLQSPVSPSPAVGNRDSPILNPQTITSAPIEIYEDEEQALDDHDLDGPTQPTQPMSQPLGRNVSGSQDDDSDFSDQDEENEPLVHAMGPFGDNLLPRMASFTTNAAPSGANDALDHADLPVKDGHTAEERPPLSEVKPIDKNDPILNHVVNQLAYSRLSSVPLSTLLNNLPSELKEANHQRKKVELEMLRALIESTSCIGEVPRKGKDAAGKPLESEYFYIPENDFDLARRSAVVEDLRKPGLRSCRKQHKVHAYSIITVISTDNSHSNTFGANRNRLSPNYFLILVEDFVPMACRTLLLKQSKMQGIEEQCSVGVRGTATYHVSYLFFASYPLATAVGPCCPALYSVLLDAQHSEALYLVFRA